MRFYHERSGVSLAYVAFKPQWDTFAALLADLD